MIDDDDDDDERRRVGFGQEAGIKYPIEWGAPQHGSLELKP